MMDWLKPILSHFCIEGHLQAAVGWGHGHINDSYLVCMGVGRQSQRYLLQRINHQIFKEPESLMNNISRVTNHLSAQLKRRGFQDVERRVLRVIPTHVGGTCYCDEQGRWWRIYPFIEGTTTHETAPSPQQAFEAARAFALFGNLLADLPPPALVETIPNFHDGPRRLLAFEGALKRDIYNRAAQAKQEIAFLIRHAAMFEVLPSLTARSLLPTRVTHNDTKLNNVLMDTASGEGLCVVDLDTVMQGLVLYDFGDFVRTTIGSSAEDEPDPSKLVLRNQIFAPLLRGFFEGFGSTLSETERNHLVFSSQLMTLLIGTRFLSDFLDGDTYFKINRENQNLERCRVQFKLLDLLLAQEEQMLKQVEKVWNSDR